MKYEKIFMMNFFLNPRLEGSCSLGMSGQKPGPARQDPPHISLPSLIVWEFRKIGSREKGRLAE
jgi:hypothetical protein